VIVPGKMVPKPLHTRWERFLGTIYGQATGVLGVLSMVPVTVDRADSYKFVRIRAS
jgi:hypothetical protein